MATLFKKLVGTKSNEEPMYQKSYQGKAIALSEDGLTMAIGAPENDSGIGCVFIYTRDTISSSWVQQSNRLRGSDYKGKSRQGTSVSLAADGNTMAIGGPDDDSGVGAVWMFKRIEGIWYQTQEKIFSWAENDEQNFGASVSLSGDGMTMAIGVPGYLYYLSTISSGTYPIGATWVCSMLLVKDKYIWKLNKRLIGNVRPGIKSYQGTGVSLSYDGTTLAINGHGPNFGDIFVFVKDAWAEPWKNSWSEQAHEIFFHFERVVFGRNVNISGDGNTLVFGGFYARNNTGITIIFLRKNNIWEYNRSYLAGHLPSAYDKTYAMHTPALSRDGLRFVSGAFRDDDRHFEIIIKSKDRNEDWNDITDPMYPEGASFDSQYLNDGYATVISGNGLCCAIGIHKHDYEITGARMVGAVRTYTSNDLSSNTSNNNSDLSIWNASPLIISPDFIGRPGQGKSIALSEDRLTLVVGGYQDRDGQGSVWVFERENVDTDEWKQSGEKLVPKDAIGKSNHGYSLALNTAGNILVVGGPGDNNNFGACWVYQKAHNGWISHNQSKLIESEVLPQGLTSVLPQGLTSVLPQGLTSVLPIDKSISGSQYGYSVAISDNYSRYGIRIIMGGPNDNSKIGGVLVFDRSESGYETKFQQTSKIEELESGETSIGESVSISGDGKRIAIGCPGNKCGSVLFFSHIGNSWIKDINTISGPGAIESSRQGASISMDRIGDTLAIGGPNDNGGIGAVWMFKRIDNKWIFNKKIVPRDSIGKSQIGSSVNLSKDGFNLIIGGPDDNNANGAVWTYKLLDDQWTYLDEKYIGSLHAGRSGVGSSVYIVNHTIAFGVPLDNEGMGGVWVGRYMGDLSIPN